MNKIPEVLYVMGVFLIIVFSACSQNWITDFPGKFVAAKTELGIPAFYTIENDQIKEIEPAGSLLAHHNSNLMTPLVSYWLRVLSS